jgi:(R,R)-butanediol dehydrogenase/meso-butanediol dehydrogenase/diacetyl reductase
MKVAVLSAVGKLTIEERPVPRVGPGEALVKVEACGICGSDVHAYLSGALFPIGTVMGHEPAGTVVEVGKGVEGHRAGDRVAIFGATSCGDCPACRRGLEFHCLNGMDRTIGNTDQLDGAYAEYLWLPFAEQMLIPIPADISFEDATLADPTATPLHAIRLSTFRPGDAVAVLGAGPIGLMAVQLLKISGAGQIICTEISPRRAGIAHQLGATRVLNPVEEAAGLAAKVAEMTGGLGVDVVFECSGVPAAFRQSFELVRPGGQVMALGVIEQETPVSPLDIVVKEIDLKGSLAYTKHEFELALELLAQGRVDTKSIISDTISLDDIEERGFRRLLSSPDVVKILVRPG